MPNRVTSWSRNYSGAKYSKQRAAAKKAAARRTRREARKMLKDRKDPLPPRHSNGWDLFNY